MSEASYRIVRKGMKQAVDHDGALEGEYATKEAAFGLRPRHIDVHS